MFIPFIGLASAMVGAFVKNESSHEANRRYRDSNLRLVRDREAAEYREFQESQAVTLMQAARQGIQLDSNQDLVNAVTSGQAGRLDSAQYLRRQAVDQSIYYHEKANRDDFYSSLWTDLLIPGFGGAAKDIYKDTSMINATDNALKSQKEIDNALNSIRRTTSYDATSGLDVFDESWMESLDPNYKPAL